MNVDAVHHDSKAVVFALPSKSMGRQASDAFVGAVALEIVQKGVSQIVAEVLTKGAASVAGGFLSFFTAMPSVGPASSLNLSIYSVSGATNKIRLGQTYLPVILLDSGVVVKPLSFRAERREGIGKWRQVWNYKLLSTDSIIKLQSYPDGLLVIPVDTPKKLVPGVYRLSVALEGDVDDSCRLTILPRKNAKAIRAVGRDRISSFVRNRILNDCYAIDTLNQPVYMDLTGDGVEEVFVRFHYDQDIDNENCGGRYTSDVCVVLGIKSGELVLFGEFSYSSVFGSCSCIPGMIRITNEEYVPSDALCCPSGMITEHYRWQSGRFQKVKEERRRDQ